MGFWSWLFRKKKPVVPRNSAAVRRYARKHRTPIHLVNLDDADVLEELLMLGLILSEDGVEYVDDPHYDETLYDVQPEVTRHDLSVFDTPAVEHPVVPEVSTEREVVQAYELPPAKVYEPDKSWASEPSSSSWSSGSDSGGWSSGGSDFGGGGGDCGGGCD